MRSLLESKVREEVLSREATALGLDKDDTIVKRRLAQKMEFVMDDVAALREPSEDELRRWFEKNPQRFAQPNLVTFRHLYFSPDRRGTRARDDAAAALQELAGKPEETPGLAARADPFMFQDFYAERAPDQVAGIFGTSFAQALLGLKEGQWQGPVESGLGWHLVWVESKIPGRVPPFEEIEATVKSEWMDEQRAEAQRKMFETMRARYQIVLPEAGATTPGGALAHAVPR
jgi:parvulin-like peptidyl-prolyl isomerase